MFYVDGMPSTERHSCFDINLHQPRFVGTVFKVGGDATPAEKLQFCTLFIFPLFESVISEREYIIISLIWCIEVKQNYVWMYKTNMIDDSGMRHGLDYV